jgi:hypothetical protein
MARRRETGVERNRRDGPLRLSKLGTREIDPALPQVLARRTSESLAKGPCEVHRVDPSIARERVDTDGFAVFVVETLAYNLEPSGHCMRVGSIELPRHARNELEREPFDGDARGIVTNSELAANSFRNRQSCYARRDRYRAKDAACHTIARNPNRVCCDDQTFCAAQTVLVFMHHSGRPKQTSLRTQLVTRARDAFR